ncbi:MAG: hypothetical protein K2X66_17465 [Cyanobacteria bacterium]|nr:hypothetical protein [Cyanobacteriota bacterium]
MDLSGLHLFPDHLFPAHQPLIDTVGGHPDLTHAMDICPEIFVDHPELIDEFISSHPKPVINSRVINSKVAETTASPSGIFKKAGNTLSNIYKGTLEVVHNLIERMIRGFNRLFGRATVESVAESALKTAAKVI